MLSDEEWENGMGRERWGWSGEPRGDQTMDAREGFSKKLMADLGFNGWWGCSKVKRGDSSQSGVSSSFRMHLEISKDSLVSQLGEGRQVPLATRDVAKCLTVHSTAYAPRQRITQPETPVVASVGNRHCPRGTPNILGRCYQQKGKQWEKKPLGSEQELDQRLQSPLLIINLKEVLDWNPGIGW